MALPKFQLADVPADEIKKDKDSNNDKKKVESKEEKKEGTPAIKKADKPKKVAKVFQRAIVEAKEAKEELNEVEKVASTNAYAGGLLADTIDTLKKKAQPLVYEHHRKEPVKKLGISLPKSTAEKLIKYAARSHDKISRIVAGLIEAFIPKDLADKELGGK